MSEPFSLEYKASPTCAAFLKSRAPRKIIAGPVGGGKTSACIIGALANAMEQMPDNDGIRRTRHIFIRNTIAQLRQTTVKSMLDWLPERVFGRYLTTQKEYYLKFKDVESEIIMLALEDESDLRRLLSLEATTIYINEGKEISQAVIEGLIGAKRVGRYPSRKSGPGATYPCIVMDTNFPNWGTYHQQIMEGEAGDWETFKQPGGRTPEAENLEFLPKDYYSTDGLTDEYVRTMIDCEYGTSKEGLPVFKDTFVKDFHVAKEPLLAIRAPDYPLVIGLDAGLCYDDQTEVLTEAGWKFFKNVEVETDVVASLNPATFEVDYTKINFKVDEQYDGTLVGWDSDNVSCLVTPEHRVPYTTRDTPGKIRFDSAENCAKISHRYVQLQARGWEGALPADTFGMDAGTFAEFLGWWCSEGSVDIQHNRITISQVKPAPDLESVLLRTGRVWARNGSAWRCSDKRLAPYLRFLGKQKVRRVPDDIRNAPQWMIEKFLHTFTRGDGSYRVRVGKSTEHIVYTASRDMAGDMQELAMKLGWASSMVFRDPAESVMADGRVISNTGIYVVRFKKTLQRAELLKKNYFEQEYHGRIYCLNVPHHILYVRRNGRPHWNGNTPAAVIGQQTPSGKLNILAECFTPKGESIGMERFLLTKLTPMITRKFPGLNAIVIVDPAAMQRSQATEETVFDIIKKAGYKVFPAPTNKIDLRIGSAETFFGQQAGGKAVLQINAECTGLISALSNGYVYSIKKDGEVEDKPEKLHPISDIVDSFTYLTSYAAGPTRKLRPEAVKMKVVSMGGWV